MPTINWTGARHHDSNPLNLNYTNKAEVMHYGEMIGYVFALENGYYQPRLVSGVAGEVCATPDSAARAVCAMHDKHERAWGRRP